MVLDAAEQGCRHPRWRTDFAANGKLHDFCLTCGAERRSTRTVDGGDAARLRNGLRWIRHMAAMNAVADPADAQQQMRALTLLAEKLLDGAELADYDSSIGAARSKTQEWAASMGIDIAAVDDSGHGAPTAAAAEPLPGPRAQDDRQDSGQVIEIDTVVALDA
jgi:hypothetical protein